MKCKSRLTITLLDLPKGATNESLESGILMVKSKKGWRELSKIHWLVFVFKANRFGGQAHRRSLISSKQVFSC
jgi:hypothetical protein